MTYLAHAVRLAARRHGANTALVAGRGPVRLTFEQLNAASEALAARLAVRGVGAGQVAALLLPNSLDYVVAYCALAKVGAITAGVGAAYSGAEREAMLERVRPHVVLGTEDLLTGPLPDAQIIPVRQVRDRREFAAGLPVLGRDPVRPPRPARRVEPTETRSTAPIAPPAGGSTPGDATRTAPTCPTTGRIRTPRPSSSPAAPPGCPRVRCSAPARSRPSPTPTPTPPRRPGRRRCSWPPGCTTSAS